MARFELDVLAGGHASGHIRLLRELSPEATGRAPVSVGMAVLITSRQLLSFATSEISALKMLYQSCLTMSAILF